MPSYDFSCGDCGCVREMNVSYEERDDQRYCPCGSELKRLFPTGAVRGIQVFEAYYDEALDADITGPDQKKEVMRIRNVIEAGDKVGGARNFDKEAPHHVKPVAPRGAKAVPRPPPDEWEVSSVSDEDMINETGEGGIITDG
tara:strand:- start:331 stop:756 length:426 start_codon:yes stop_codon:yes gene_type:complete